MVSKRSSTMIQRVLTSFSYTFVPILSRSLKSVNAISCVYISEILEFREAKMTYRKEESTIRERDSNASCNRICEMDSYST